MVDELKNDCLKKQEKYQQRLENYINYIKRNQFLKTKENHFDLNFDASVTLKDHSKDKIIYPNNYSKRIKSKSMSIKKIGNTQENSLLNFPIKAKLLENSNYDNINSPKQNQQLKTTLSKLGKWQNMKGLPQKRSNTLRLKILDEYESLKDVCETERVKKNDLLKVNYSLSKNNNAEKIYPELSDPYCLISILDPKIKTQMKLNSDRCKLMRKKLTK